MKLPCYNLSLGQKLQLSFFLSFLLLQSIFSASTNKYLLHFLHFQLYIIQVHTNISISILLFFSLLQVLYFCFKFFLLNYNKFWILQHGFCLTFNYFCFFFFFVFGFGTIYINMSLFLIFLFCLKITLFVCYLVDSSYVKHKNMVIGFIKIVSFLF